MARTTLSRRIRRIGLTPQVKDENGHITRPVVEYTHDFFIAETARLRGERSARRAKVRGKKAGK